MPSTGRSAGCVRTGLCLVLMGGLLVGCGSTLGERLDAVDRQLIMAATQEALEKNQTGEAKNWHNPKNGHRGTVVPTRTYKISGAHCREFQQTATVEGQTIIAYNAACRGAGGRWKSEYYASLDGVIADAPPYHHSGYYGHHDPHYRFGFGYGHRFGRFGRFGHFGYYW